MPGQRVVCELYSSVRVYLKVHPESCTRDKSAQAEQRQEEGFGDYGAVTVQRSALIHC